MAQNRGKLCFLIALLLIGITNCASPATKQIPGPDGTPHELVSCNFIENCYMDAAKVCGGKYKIVNTSNEVSGFRGSRNFEIMLLVKCEAPATPTPSLAPPRSQN